MIFAAAALAALLAFFLYTRSKKDGGEVTHDTTPVLEGWIRSALEQELAESVLGIRGATPEERKKLVRTLANEPDADVVTKIEETVKAIELEFVRYAHEAEVETTVRVRYEDGKTGTSTKRLALADVPTSVKTDFEKKGSTHVFRTWSFPWQHASAL